MRSENIQCMTNWDIWRRSGQPTGCPAPRCQVMTQVPDASPQKPLHQRLTSPSDEEVDPLLQQTGCAAPYTALEVRKAAAAERRPAASGLPRLPSCLPDRWLRNPCRRRSAWGSTTATGSSARRVSNGWSCRCPSRKPTPLPASDPAPPCLCACAEVQALKECHAKQQQLQAAAAAEAKGGS